MHPRAIPRDYKMADSEQTTLDNVLTPKVPAFTKSGLLDHIIELVVSEDEVCVPANLQ